MVRKEVEALLQREERAQLPFRLQLLLYLHPFALFKDASKGTALVREAALRYNRAMRWMLLGYMRRWALIAGASFLAIAPSEALAAETRIFIVPAAAFAFGVCIAVTIVACTAATYFLLSRDRA